MKDLTNSNIDRQNILNNRYSLEKIQDFIGLPGMLFDGEYKFTIKMVTEFFEIDERTVKRYLEEFEAELMPGKISYNTLYSQLFKLQIATLQFSCN